MSIKRKWKNIEKLCTLVVATVLTIVLLNSKSVQITGEDRMYLDRFLSDWDMHQSRGQVHQNFQSELNFISAIQDSVLANITGEQIPHAYFGNVCYYYQKRQGICYDRAVLLEKILLLYNFPFRHVYIYFRGRQGATMTDFFKKDIISHAALEVKTIKGWMAVGTDANWLGVTKSGQVQNYFDVRKELASTNGNPSFQKPLSNGTGLWNSLGYHFRIVYGIYSRHGDFFTGASQINSTSLFTNKRHFLPDYNLRMLFYNLY